MQRYRMEWVTQRNLDAVNQLLLRGWRPLREQPLPPAAEAGAESGDVLIVLEREDEFPVFSGELLPDGTPLASLQDVPLLRGLTGPELREVVSAAEVRQYAAEAVLFDEAQSERRIYIVLAGSVSIQLLGLEIDDPVVLQAGPRDVFGEASVFAPSPYSTRATAGAGATTLELAGAVFDDLFQAGRPAAAKLALNGAAILADRLRATDAWIREMLQGEKSAEAARSWRRFRHSRSSRTSRPGAGGFIHIT